MPMADVWSINMEHRRTQPLWLNDLRICALRGFDPGETNVIG